MLYSGLRRASLSSMLLLLTWGCASTSGDPAGTGGKTGTGGATTAGTGGSSAGSGGAPTSGSGGGLGSGGAPFGTGGSASGGAAQSGGATGSGGGVATGGVAPGGSGGANGSGGAADGGVTDGSVDGVTPVGGRGGNGAGTGGAGGGGTVGMTSCGTMRPSLAGITGLEGLVIGPDGTIYFTRPSTNFLGRYRPPYASPELSWADMKGGAFGITIDPKRGVIYAGSRPLRKLVKIVVADPPVVTNLADVEATVNGVTLGEDGAVYYTDQGSGHVFRVTAEGVKTQVTTSPVADANGIAFGPDGNLYVLTYVAARVTKLTVVAGRETARTPFVTITNGRNADGIAFDATGQMYVTGGGLFRISADGQMQAALSCGTVGGANIDFGTGALACTDIYSAGNGGLFRCANPTAGMNVPWHRAPN